MKTKKSKITFDIGVFDNQVLWVLTDEESDIKVRQQLTPEEAQRIGYALILGAAKIVTDEDDET